MIQRQDSVIQHQEVVSPDPHGLAYEAGYLLEVSSICKSFTGVQALKDVSLRVKPGTVHAVLGENGAGKSTLMKILMGLYQRDRGEIRLKGKPVDFKSPKDALAAGITIIEQELNPVDEMTVAENIFLGREPTWGLIFVDYTTLNNKAKDILARIGLNIDPHRKMHSLSVAEIQLVEIAKALSYNADIIIMDEPTSAIGDKETDRLMALIRSLKQRGTGILYISHKLEEIFTIADEITVLRDGNYVATRSVDEVDREQLIRMMIGRDVSGFPKDNLPTSEEILIVEGFTRKGKFSDISMVVHKGEIVGIYGLLGAGKTEFIEALFGVHCVDAGKMRLRGRTIEIKHPGQAIRLGMGLITEDRKRSGLFLPMSIVDNASIAALVNHQRLGFVDEQLVHKHVSSYTAMFDVRMASMRQLVKYLSGGNQQKVILARWLVTEPNLLLLDEPTRGIDIGAKREIYRFMSDFANQGNAIVMASSELPEILGMSDRILVFKQGRLTGELTHQEATEETVMALAI